MLLSPMVRSALAAALLLLSAEAKKLAFMMEPTFNVRSSGANQRLLAKLMAKAQPRRLDQQNQEENGWGFDMETYSVKYTGCSAIKTYSDEQAQGGDTVLEAKRFVVFRLCPSDSCSKYSADGCSADYGEYVMEMGDYLETMTQYQEEKSQNYCAYCEQCAENQMNGGNNNNQNQNNNADEEEEQGDDAGRRRADEAADGDDAAAADGDDAAAADGDDAAAADGDDAAGDDAAAAEDCYSICYDYNKLCNDGNNNNNQNGDDEQQQEEINIEEYLECRQVDNENNGNTYYLGPHCESDGHTISIGLYSDETCSTYIGHEMSVYDATGLDLSVVDMSIYYPQDCQSCKENEFEWENNEEDEQDEDNVNEMCENLYMVSAKCNKNFDTLNANNNYYYSAQQEANGEQVCNFIDNIKYGKYDEDGEIIIDVYAFNISNWKDKSQYIKTYNNAKQDVTPVQIAFLVISIVGCFILSIVACCLHGSLTRKGLQWRPRRGKWTSPTDISRQNSGIVMGRSRSGPGGAPLV